MGCDVKSLDVETVETPSPARMDTSDNSQAFFDDLIKSCLHVAALQWSDVDLSRSVLDIFRHGRSRYSSSSSSSSVEEREEANAIKIKRVVEVLEELIVSGDMSLCGDVFEDILKASLSEPVGKTIVELYVHLLPPVCKLLSKLNQDFSAPPFVDFLQDIIAMYLKNVLGDKDELYNCLLRLVACKDDCRDCQLVDAFLLDPTTTSRVFRLGYYDEVASKRQNHLDIRVNRV